MPIWAYFYEKVLKDKSLLGIDPNVSFIKPEGMATDFNFDSLNGIAAPVGTEDENTGNVATQNYVPAGIKPEELSPESEIPLDKANQSNKANDNKKPITPPANAANPIQKPKAAMPKKIGTNK